MKTTSSAHERGRCISDVHNPESKSANEIALSVIVPVFNEAATVAVMLERLWSIECVSRIIVVDDGSTDGTFESVKEATDLRENVLIVQHEVNQGKGAAIRTGLDHVDTSHVTVQDADLEYDPEDIHTLWEKMCTGDVDVVFGSRYLNDRTIQTGRFILQSGVRLLNFVTFTVYGLRLTDEATCYKMFRTYDLRKMNLQCKRFEFCPEVTAKAARLGLKISEVPISYQARLASEGKKLRLRDGYYAIRELLSWRNWKPDRADGKP